jgi:hypothetical protein
MAKYVIEGRPELGLVLVVHPDVTLGSVFVFELAELSLYWS